MVDVTDIKYALQSHFSNHKYTLFNTYVFQWESDFFCVSTSDYVVEVEIKITRFDYKVDFLKHTRRGLLKHDVLHSNPESHWIPNKYYFACPWGLIKKEDVPPQYGLIWIESQFRWFVVKEAKFLHKDKLFQERVFVQRVLDKFYWQCQQLRIELALKNADIKNNQLNLFSFNL